MQQTLPCALLFTPASDPTKLRKAPECGAGAVIVDLEDSVPPAMKETARTIAAAALRDFPASVIGLARVNAPGTPYFEDDIEAVVGPGLRGLVVPKLESPDTLTVIDELVTAAEQRCGLPAGSINLLPLIETPRGLVQCEAIAEAAPARTWTLALGGGDLAVELGITPTGAGPAIDHARARIAIAARAAGLRRAIDGPFLNLADVDGLRVDSERARELGFGGRLVLHPCQIPPVLATWTDPSREEIRRAEEQVAAYERAQRDGVGAVRVGDQFVDYPIYRQASHILAAHRRSDLV